MKLFFTYLGIEIVMGIVPGFASESTGGDFLFMVSVISAIFGALIGGYWKNNMGAWTGGLIMGFAPLILIPVLF